MRFRYGIILLFISCNLYAEGISVSNPRILIEEEDGVPSQRYGLLKFPNGSLDDRTSFYIVLSSAFLKSGSSNYIINSDLPQGATFYVSSGTVREFYIEQGTVGTNGILYVYPSSPPVAGQTPHIDKIVGNYNYLIWGGDASGGGGGAQSSLAGSKATSTLSMESQATINIGTFNFTNGGGTQTYAGVPILISSVADADISTLTVFIPAYRHFYMVINASWTVGAAQVRVTFNNGLDNDDNRYGVQWSTFLAGANPTTASTSNALGLLLPSVFANGGYGEWSGVVRVGSNQVNWNKVGTFHITQSQTVDAQSRTGIGSFRWFNLTDVITQVEITLFKGTLNRGGGVFKSGTSIEVYGGAP